jgi:hypothetical protein
MNYHIVASCFRASCVQTHMEDHLEPIKYNLRNLNWTVTDLHRPEQMLSLMDQVQNDAVHRMGGSALTQTWWSCTLKSAEHLIMSLPVWLGCDGRAVHSSHNFQIILNTQTFNVSFCVDYYTAGLLKLNVPYICSYHIGCSIYGDLDTMRVWRQSSIRRAPISVAARDTEGGLDGFNLSQLQQAPMLDKQMFNV